MKYVKDLLSSLIQVVGEFLLAVWPKGICPACGRKTLVSVSLDPNCFSESLLCGNRIYLLGCLECEYKETFYPCINSSKLWGGSNVFHNASSSER